MMRRGLTTALGVTLVGLLGAGCSYVGRASVDTAGGNPNSDAYSSDPVSISDDGRYVAFASDASDLVASDSNGHLDVFVRDLRDGVTERVSVDAAGNDADGPSFNAAISGDGRYVAFTSGATDLVAGDDGLFGDVFVRDLVSNTTAKVSVTPSGGNADGNSAWPAISGDGRYVSFYSQASLVAGDDWPGDIFVRDLVAETTEKVSYDASGGLANGDSFFSSVSDDGRYVAFESFASDLVPGDGSGGQDVFLRDLLLDTTTRISVDTTGGDPDLFSSSVRPAISSSGRHVAFASNASDLVAGGVDDDFDSDVFVRDVELGATALVTFDALGEDFDGSAFVTSISDDGRHVAFTSDASDLVVGDTNGSVDVFVRDLTFGTTRRMSVNALGGEGSSAAAFAAISGNGQYVAFISEDLTGSDGDDFADVFVRFTRQPSFNDVSPTSLTPGSTVDITVLGWDFLAGASASIGGGVAVNSVGVVSENELVLSLTVDPEADPGPRSILVTNPGTGPGPNSGASAVCGACVGVA